MKLIFLLLTITAMHVSANSFAQKISINEKNASLERIFNRIKNQTGYDFFFDKTLLNKAKLVTVNVKEASLEETLKRCFINQPFTYIIQEKTIVVTPREANSANLIIKEMQQKVVTGKVMDVQGEPLAGVSIKVKNAQINT
ncbi:secretin and TonB N-terminal domain-containing protein, partial [Pseudopedobacter sp.]|uniref:STN domain-containing protein n=1 Tax=Pseudopedobacter sp. TaxID=1936787 RepID=UPI00333EAD62